MYTKAFEMYGVAKAGVTGLLLGAMLVMAGNAGAASINDCAAGITLKGGGVVECVGGGAAFTPCSGNLVLDSTGNVGCVVVLLPPTCSLTPASSTIATGGAATLTASCSPAATSYTWTGGTCAGKTTSTCTVTGGQTAGTTPYTVTGANASGAGNTASATVTVTAASSSTSTPTCNITQMAYFSKIIISSNCTPAATEYIWVNTGFSNTTSGGFIDPPAATTTYSVTGINAAGTGNTSSVTVTISNSCSLTASPSSIYQGQSSTLTASCSPAATGYTFNGATCLAGSTANTCVVAPNINTSYTVTGTGGNTATSPPVTVTVTPPSCTVTATLSTVAVGETSTLTANCTPMASAYSWTTTGTCTNGLAAQTCTVNPATPTGAATYSVTGTVGGNPVVSNQVTVTAVAAYCTLSATSPIALSQPTTLTATCHPAATSYDWGGTCAAGPGNTCIVTPGSTGNITYSVIGTVNGGSVGPVSTTVTVNPATCTVTASPSTISVGQSSILTASCNPAATSYNWNGACGGTGSTCTVTPAAAGTVSYTVTGTVGGSSVASAPVSVTVAAAQCSVGTINWASGLTAYGGNGGTPVQRISTGQMQAFALQRQNSVAPVYVAYGQCRMEMAISSSACDFAVAPSCYNVTIDPAVSVRTSDYAVTPGSCTVQTNTTFYVNIRQLAGYEIDNCTYYLVH